jgi:uncharacterized protein YeeX (DUF496 family)
MMELKQAMIKVDNLCSDIEKKLREVRARVAELENLYAELLLARAVCFAVEKYIMMPTHDDNGELIDDGHEWETIIAALSAWAKARDAA